MENKKQMVVFYLTEIDEIWDASKNNKGIEIRRLINRVIDEPGRRIKMEG